MFWSMEIVFDGLLDIFDIGKLMIPVFLLEEQTLCREPNNN